MAILPQILSPCSDYPGTIIAIGQLANPVAPNAKGNHMEILRTGLYCAGVVVELAGVALSISVIQTSGDMLSANHNTPDPWPIGVRDSVGTN